MNAGFSPSFKDLQDDIERYLKAEGKTERTPDGFTVFHGYYDALNRMFRLYLEQRAFGPLVAHFRSWNWEVGDNDYLQELSTTLYEAGDWPHLQALWDRVLAKRRRLYNEMRRIERKEPGSIPPEEVAHLKELLIKTLQRLKGFAGDLGTVQDFERYARILERIERGLNA